MDNIVKNVHINLRSDLVDVLSEYCKIHGLSYENALNHIVAFYFDLLLVPEESDG